MMVTGYVPIVYLPVYNFPIDVVAGYECFPARVYYQRYMFLSYYLLYAAGVVTRTPPWLLLWGQSFC